MNLSPEMTDDEREEFASQEVPMPIQAWVIEPYVALVGPESSDIFIDACNKLLAVNVESHEVAFSGITAMYNANNIDNSAYVAMMENALQTTLFDCLLEHGVEVTGTNILALSQILDTIITVLDYGDPLAIQQIIEDTNEPLLTLVDVTAFLQGCRTVEIMETLVRVSYDFHDMLRSKINEAVESMENSNPTPPTINVAAVRARFKAYVEENNNDSFIATSLIRSGVCLGFNYAVMMEALHDTLDGMDTPQLLRELIALALASELADVTAIETEIKATLEGLISDLNELSRANSELHEALAGVL